MSNIGWAFLDKRQATEDAIRAYDQMQFVIDHTDEDIRRARERMVEISSPKLTGGPGGPHDPHATEGKIVDAINEIDTLKERYRQAVEYMKWFMPAWEYLSEEERYVLDAFCHDNEYGDGVADSVAEAFNISRSSAYSRKKRAIRKLMYLLYGVE